MSGNGSFSMKTQFEVRYIKWAPRKWVVNGRENGQAMRPSVFSACGARPDCGTMRLHAVVRLLLNHEEPI
jgi:hypothetical protein